LIYILLVREVSTNRWTISMTQDKALHVLSEVSIVHKMKDWLFLLPKVYIKWETNKTSCT